VKLNRSGAALSLLAAAALLVSACSNNSSPPPPYAGSAKVDCGGKQSLNASGSTAQANAMTRFISAYQKACPGQTLTYTPNGSGAGISEFLSSHTDFAGSDSPLSGDQYTQAQQRCEMDRNLGHAFSYCTVSVTVAVCVSGPLTAVTVTV